MITYEQKQWINKHPNYRLTFLSEDELRNELKGWCRENLISWLKWNDPNGIYTDKESMAELGIILTYEEGVELIVKQVCQTEV